MGATAPLACVLTRVIPYSLPVGCASVAVVSGDGVLSSSPGGNVCGIALFPGDRGTSS